MDRRKQPCGLPRRRTELHVARGRGRWAPVVAPVPTFEGKVGQCSSCHLRRMWQLGARRRRGRRAPPSPSWAAVLAKGEAGLGCRAGEGEDECHLLPKDQLQRQLSCREAPGTPGVARRGSVKRGPEWYKGPCRGGLGAAQRPLQELTPPTGRPLGFQPSLGPRRLKRATQGHVLFWRGRPHPVSGQCEIRKAHPPCANSRPPAEGPTHP